MPRNARKSALKQKKVSAVAAVAKESGKAPAATPGQGVLTMEEVIAMLKTTRPTFYRWLREGKIKAFKAGRQWRFERQDIERFLKGDQPRVDAPVSALPLVQHLRAQLEALGQKIDGPETSQDPISAVVNLMILLGCGQGATDIHIEPQYDGQAGSLLLRNRIDGVLHVIARADARLLPAIAERFKNLAALNLAEKRVPQDGRITLKIGGKVLDIRVACVPAALGESITLRLLPQVPLDLDLGKPQYAPRDLKLLREAIHAPYGLVVCTGPTGSGKTTTLYSCLTELAGPEVKCMTIEDPVEYLIPYATQVQLNEQAGLNCSRALRALLRSAPNVIVVGEIRDLETLELTIQAAATGHMVLTTLHAEDCAAALVRMVEIGAAPFLVGDVTRLIVSQRLVRVLCPHCSRPVQLTADEQAMLAQAPAWGLAMDTFPRDFRQPVGCAQCGQTGYKGRIVIAETLGMTPKIARALRDHATADELRRLTVAEGMTTMEADGVRKAAAGITTLREVQRVRCM